MKQYILQYGDKVKLMQLNKNMGKGAAVKYGVQYAIGNYILMVIIIESCHTFILF